MSYRLTAKWASPVAAVALTLAVVFAVNALHASSASPTRPATHSVAAAAPAAVTTSRIVLSTGTFGTFAFTQLAGITSQVDQVQYLTSDGTKVIAPIKYGRTKPPVVTLKRTLTTDTPGMKLFAWHQQVTDGSPTAAIDAHLTIYDSTGKADIVYVLHDAWPSKIDISGVKAGTTEATTVTVTVVCTQITVQ